MKLPLLVAYLAAYVAASVIERAPLPLVTEGPTARAIAIEKRQAASLTATVTLSSNIGAPSHLASGFIYGIPDVAGQIPDSFYTGMVILATMIRLATLIMIFIGVQFRESWRCASRSTRSRVDMG